MRILIAACLFTVAFAGCVAPSSALELRDEAEAAAADLDADAVLVAVFGPEWTNESFEEQFTQESPEASAIAQGVDANPGDGLANAWGFLFRSDDQAIFIAVAADGSILESHPIPDDSNTAESYGDDTPLGEVAIDSEEAATIVHDNHDRFSDLVQEDDVVVVMALARDDDQDAPFWVFTAFTQNGEDIVFALVNADDGSYQDFSSFFGG